MGAETTYIGFFNRKGGVGKTMLTAHCGVYLARRGYRVCLVDADSQGNLSSWLLSAVSETNGLIKLLVAHLPVMECWVPVRGEWGVALIPGNWETGKALSYVVDGVTPFNTIRTLLHELDGVVDYVLVDMSPSRLPGFLELLYACDQILVPADMARHAVEGIGSLAQALKQIERACGSAPKLLGIVPNKFRGTRIEKARMVQLVNRFGAAVWPAIPLAIKVQEACDFGKTLFSHAPKAKVTLAVSRICERVEQNSRGG